MYQGLLGSFWAAVFLVILLLPGVVFMVFALHKWRAEEGRIKWLHLIYLLLFSLFIEWLGVIVAYWFIFELQFEQLPKVLVNPVFLWILMLFFSFLHDRFFAEKIEAKNEEAGPIWFDLVSERKRIRIDLKKLLYIESSNEQCVLKLEDDQFPTRERISQLEERLPEGFLRIHRSFIINPEQASSIQKSKVLIAEEELPVSRSYKTKVEAYLEQQKKPLED